MHNTLPYKITMQHSSTNHIMLCKTYNINKYNLPIRCAAVMKTGPLPAINVNVNGMSPAKFKSNIHLMNKTQNEIIPHLICLVGNYDIGLIRLPLHSLLRCRPRY